MCVGGPCLRADEKLSRITECVHHDTPQAAAWNHLTVKLTDTFRQLCINVNEDHCIFLMPFKYCINNSRIMPYWSLQAEPVLRRFCLIDTTTKTQIMTGQHDLFRGVCWFRIMRAIKTKKQQRLTEMTNSTNISRFSKVQSQMFIYLLGHVFWNRANPVWDSDSLSGLITAWVTERHDSPEISNSRIRRLHISGNRMR